MKYLVTIVLCSLGFSFNITNKLLTGFNFTKGIANVYALTDDILVTSGGVSDCPLGCADCDAKGCTLCNHGKVRYNPSTKRNACYCFFGSRWDGKTCSVISMPSCIEPASPTVCGFSIANGFLAARAIADQFNITAFTKYIANDALVDTLDSFFLLSSMYDSSNGFTEAGLQSAIFWLRGIPITMPEVIIYLEDSIWDKQAIKMKAILGYWQNPSITFSGQRILLNNLDYTKEIVSVLQTLGETSWQAFGTALGKMLNRVPASSYTLSLPTDYGCPPSWWICTDDETSLIVFVWSIIESMKLDSGVTYEMVQDAVDEADIKYLYHFYNLVTITNMNGGFDPTEATNAFISLYEAIKSLTDAGTSGSVEASAISRFQTAIQSIAVPRVVSINRNYYVNGQNVWYYFGEVIFNLTQGYTDRAGVSVGKILLALNTPQRYPVDGYKDEIYPSIAAASHAREFLSVLLATYSSKNGGRMLAARKLDSCLDNANDSVKESAKTLTALETGKWVSALYHGIKAVCNYADVADTCQDKFDLPDEIMEMCNILENWPDLVLDAAQYLFKFAEKNLFPNFIKAANSVFRGIAEEVGDFFGDAGEEIGGCLMDVMHAFLGGPMLSISAAAVLIAAQL